MERQQPPVIREDAPVSYWLNYVTSCSSCLMYGIGLNFTDVGVDEAASTTTGTIV
jgi:hypothetical protein